MSDEVNRQAHRKIAEGITDETLMTPVGELDAIDAALLQAALEGPFADRLYERIKALGKEHKHEQN